VEFDRRRLGRMWRSRDAVGGFLALCRRLRKARYDWVIDLQGLFRSGFLSWVTRAPVRAGFAAAREFAPTFYNFALPVEGMPQHTVDRNIALARRLGIDARPGDYQLFVPPAGAQWAADFDRGLDGDYIVVAPATRWRTKLYPAARWRCVVNALAKRLTVVLTAGPGEERFTAPLADAANVVDLAGKTTLPQLLGLVARSRGVVSCDSAAMNIATALGKPQVVIVGPTDPARTGPYGRPESVLQAQLPCQGCLRRECPHIVCMELVPPDAILAAVEQLLLGTEHSLRL